MKTTFKLFFLVIASIILLLSCTNDSDSLTDEVIAEEQIEENIPMGTVSLNAMLKDRIEVQTGKVSNLNEVLDNLIVVISNEANVSEFSYNNLPTFIELTPGPYEIYMFSQNYRLEARFDVGEYESEVIPVDVLPGQNTEVDVSLSLLDVAITINFDAEIILNYPNVFVLAEVLYDPDSGFSSMNDLDWQANTGGRVGYIPMKSNAYFDDSIFRGDLYIEISATNSLGNPIKVRKTYEDVKANQHYKISIKYTSQSTASLIITLGDEEVIEDEINFPN